MTTAGILGQDTLTFTRTGSTLATITASPNQLTLNGSTGGTTVLVSQLTTPINPTDAVNKLYVDSLVNVTSVTGTVDQIDVSPTTGNCVVSIDPNYPGQTSINTLGTIGTGIWQGTVIGSTYGGTGVNNGSSLLTLGGSLTTSGAFSSTFTMTGPTSVTFPTSGTLLSTTSSFVSSVTGTAGEIDVSPTTGNCVVSIDPGYVGQTSITTLGTIGTGVWHGTIIDPIYGGTGVNNGTSTLTLGGSLITSGAFSSTFTMTGPTSVTFPTSGTLATTTTANVASVSGTAGEIDVAPTTGNCVVSIDPGYVGQTSITTLGTIGTGVWHGTPITVPYGGTGNTTFTAYSVVCAGTTATGIFQNVSGVGTTGQILTSNGASTLPTWQTVPQLRITYITSGTTYTTPAGITTSTQFKFILVGGGGGGGGMATANGHACGGGAGGTGIVLISGLTPSTAYTIAIGAAGAQGTNAPTAGGSGGNTTLLIGATTYTAAGGGGGPDTINTAEGGVGGTTTNCTIGIAGQTGGGSGTASATTVAMATGFGGSSGLGYGLGGVGWVPFVGDDGLNGTGFGSGGGGAANTGIGGFGTQGAIVVEYIM